MESSAKPLDTALRQHQAKLQGLSESEVRQAADRGATLVVVASVARSFDAEEAELLLDEGERRIWVCQASCDRLLAWLADDQVIAVCADELPDVRIGQD